MDVNSVWIQIIIGVIGSLLASLLIALTVSQRIRRALKGILNRSIPHVLLTPLRKLRSRLLLRRMQVVCVAANAADGHWDKFAAAYITEFLYGENQGLPVYLPKDQQEWTPFWEAVGLRRLSLLIIGSHKRFSFTEYILDRIEKLAESPGRSLDLPRFSKPSPLSVREYPDEAHIIVVKWLKLRDSYKVERTFRRMILIMGESGPATLAACHVYLANPQLFEPEQFFIKRIRSNEAKPMVGRISTLNLLVRYKEADDLPRSYDYRYVQPDSIKLIRQRDFAKANIGEEVSRVRLIRPLSRDITLPTGRDRDDWHYFSPRKFLTALPNLRNHRKDDIPQGQRWPVRWGWKRDSDDGKLTRIVYLSAFLLFDGKDLVCVDPYFYLYHRADAKDIRDLMAKCEKIQARDDIPFSVSAQATSETLKFQIGRPRVIDSDLVERLSNRIPEPPHPSRLPELSEVDDLLDYTPCDLYVGSGLSYEVGIPAMRLLHVIFHVDDGESIFKFASNDGLVSEIEHDWVHTFRKLMTVDIEYIRSEPGVSHRRIKWLQDKRFVRQVYSDNVDDLLERAGIRTVRTRGTGLFNECFDVRAGALEHRLSSTKDVPYLWVVGVSADRRAIIEQARLEGKTVVVINPDEPVSPKSKRVDYLQGGGVFIKKRFKDVEIRIYEEQA